MQTYSPNDIVNIEGVGYCLLVSCGRHKTLRLPRKHTIDDALKPLYFSKQKESLYFDPESFLFEEAAMIVVPPESSPIALPDIPEPELSLQREAKRGEVVEQQEDPAANEPNIIKAKIYRTEYCVYAPESKLSQHVKIRVKTMFCNREEFVFHINISSTILQLKNKIIEMTKEPPSNFDNIRLLSSDGFIQQFANNKELIYQTKIRDNSKLLLIASIRFSMDANEKGQNLTLSNNNRTIAKTAKEGKFELSLATIQINNGKLYFQTKIDKITQDDDLFIGVAKKGIALSIKSHTVQQIPFWGYNCMAGRKYFGSSVTDVLPKSSVFDFGLICKPNDNIGTLIQVQKKIATISYYVNGKFIGKALENIECPVAPCIILGSGDMQVTVNCLADVPFDAANYMN